jgi:hypothetical protein
MKLQIRHRDPRLTRSITRKLQVRILPTVRQITQHRRYIHDFLLLAVLEEGQEREGEEDLGGDVGAELDVPFYGCGVGDSQVEGGAGAGHYACVAGRGLVVLLFGFGW